MIEAKAYNAQRHSGVGFGNGRGEGPQVDLLHSNQSALRLLDQSVRWVLADATCLGASRYACFDCTAASQAAMGGVARGKQNNFQLVRVETANDDLGFVLPQPRTSLLAPGPQLSVWAAQHLVRADGGFAASGYAGFASKVIGWRWSLASGAAAAQLGRWLASSRPAYSALRIVI